MPEESWVAFDDLALMHRFQSGDRRAFEELVRRHLAFVIRQAARYVGDEAAAEDVAQEVFLRVFRSGELFREATSFLGWLATITSRLALNELRTRQRKHWVARSSLECGSAVVEAALETRAWVPGNADVEGPDGELLREERIRLVREALARMPENQRMALTLQRFDGWDLQQIGATMGLSGSATKSLLHRARHRLAQELKGLLDDTAGCSGGTAGALHDDHARSSEPRSENGT